MGAPAPLRRQPGQDEPAAAKILGQDRRTPTVVDDHSGEVGRAGCERDDAAPLPAVRAAPGHVEAAAIGVRDYRRRLRADGEHCLRVHRRHELALGRRCKRERSYEGEEYGRQPDSC